MRVMGSWLKRSKCRCSSSWLELRRARDTKDVNKAPSKVIGTIVGSRIPTRGAGGE
jgi:hypothetical protein